MEKKSSKHWHSCFDLWSFGWICNYDELRRYFNKKGKNRGAVKSGEDPKNSK